MVLVAESGNEIIGCNHAIFERIKVGGVTLLCRQGVDSAVHPNFRGMGVYSKMSELKSRLDSEIDLGLHYAVSTNPIIAKASERKKDHMLFPHSIVELIRIRDIDLHLAKNDVQKALLKKYGFHAVKALNILNKKALLNGFKFSISEMNRFDEQIDVFWGKIKDSYSFIAERSRNYLNWRFCDPRGGRYIVKQIEDEEGLIGYIVLRINSYKADYPIGYIVDLCTLPDRLDCAEALILDSVNYFDDHGVNLISYWIVKNHPYERLLKRHGFLDSRKDNRVSAAPMKELDNFSSASADRFLFQYGDSDWI
jgi:hypothetical protein